ncbi:multicopper oxidase domain-containing protein [Microbispora sp. H13382]|uniref:multicopper oxidase domain-containing protein n=1 Tax=Microbispora sp. H13382 TaxID=2729112 RepID=UPI001602E6AB|nr:multicopper oxidase domain-containing protein [Microbispora sp. H13382]
MRTVDVRVGAPGPGPTPPTRRRSRASWHARANGVVLAWLALAALATLTHDHLPAPRWLLIHVFLLGAVTNAIVTWTEHFAIALLRRGEPSPWVRPVRLAALNTGVAAVLYGATYGPVRLGIAGAALVVGVIGWHVAILVSWSRRALGGRFAHVVAWYIGAGAALVTGGTLGGLMLAAWPPGTSSTRLQAAHVHVNLLGWVGLAVLGTLFTLWPTVLRTQVAEGSGVIARRSLRLAVPGLAVTVGGFLGGARWVAVAGLLLYAAAAALALVPFLRTARRRPPHTPAAWMLAAGTAWFVVAVLADLSVVATRPADQVAHGIEPLVPFTLVGFAGQTLLGALTFLLPVVLGGGPAALKRNAALLERGWIIRLAVVNVAVPLIALPVPGRVSLIAWGFVVAALAAFVLLAAVTVGRARGPRVSPTVGGVAVGLLATAVAVALALSDGRGVTPAAKLAVQDNGAGVRTVEVTLANMRIMPGTIEAAPGTRLVLRVTNRDAQQHDLRLATGQRTPMLGAGQTATLELPPLAGPIDGWCTVPGHRAAGMTMRIDVKGTGRAPESGMDHSGRTDHMATAPGVLNLAAPMSPGWRPYDATLRPASGGTEHRMEIHAVRKDIEVAPGVRQRMWTFGGTVPGPVLRGKVGDVFTITLVNDDTMGHGIDFHAGSLAPDVPMRTIRPGEHLTYRFRAEHAGAWLYHCSTMPMLQHIANGMYGAVIIDPPNLAPVDREYVLVQGELYLGQPGGTEQVSKMRDGRPDAWMFNGTAAGYDHAPMTARPGERVRVWVVAAGPASGTAFHIVGAQFDTVYKEGAYLLRPGQGDGASQVLDLAAAQGGFVETAFPEPGHYPFVDHDMRHGEAGAHGIFEVTR